MIGLVDLGLMGGCDASPSPPLESDPTTVSEPAASPFDFEHVPPPLEWADWPLEYVAIRGNFGWRIEPDGSYSRAESMRFETEPDAYVLAIASGRVREIVRDESGMAEIVVEHEQGLESRYRPIDASLVHADMKVVRGVALGLSGGRELLLQVRSRGEPIDPALIIGAPLYPWPPTE